MIIAGVDEAGRGPLAGPVVASAVVLPETYLIDGLRDSKKCTQKQREKLYNEIFEKAISVGVGLVHEDEIDRVNIFQATRKAMKKAIARLNIKIDEAWIDGFGFSDQIVKNRGIIDGDEKIPSISAASIIAKVTRDRLLLEYDSIFPDYGFANHKGYGTREHIVKLKKYKACPIHRKTFHPVKENLPSVAFLEENKRIGKWGEWLAAKYLIHKGYKIITMNYHAAPYGEIDIVARKETKISLVEVKTAVRQKSFKPYERIDELKLNKLMSAFEIYAANYDPELEYQFDIISVVLGMGKPIIQHFTNVEI